MIMVSALQIDKAVFFSTTIFNIPTPSNLSPFKQPGQRMRILAPFPVKTSGCSQAPPPGDSRCAVDAAIVTAVEQGSEIRSHSECH
jgi:hypothetical protein